MEDWKNCLMDLMSHQVRTLFKANLEKCLTNDLIENAIQHTQKCIMGFRLNIHREDDNSNEEIVIHPFYSIEYTIFLYWMSREFYRKENIVMATWIYYLNKTLNCVELFYEVELPSVWSCEHPLGTIIGKAKYSDYFFFYQGCTVGANFKHNGSIEYPEFGTHVKMLSNSKVLGSSHVGNNVIISANAYIKDEDVPDDVIVFGTSPHLIFKPNYFIEKCPVDNILSK